MTFYDEELINARIEAKKAKYDSLETGMYAGEELLEFNKIWLFDSKFSIYIPVSFTDMPDEWKKSKYPYERKPQSIYTDKSGSVNLCFSLLKSDVEPINIKEALDGFLIVLRKMNPSNLFLDKGILKAENLECAWCEMRGQTIDGNIYSILFICEIDKQLLLGTFSCPYVEKENWNKITFKIIQSIYEEGQDEGK